jgi:hypothetical protein
MSANRAQLRFIAVGLVGLGVGIMAGGRVGRYEQKKSDDAWYAAHPVVKEVAPQIDYEKLLFWKDETGAICRLSDEFPERNYTCLNLPKPHDGLCEGWSGIWWGPRPCPILRRAEAPQERKKPE